MIHRTVFEAVGLFDESLPACEDYDLWLRICGRYPVRYLDEPLVIKHGGHEDQLSRKYWGMDRFRIRALQKIIDSGKLEPGDRQAAIECLIRKSSIYLGGSKRRNKHDEAEHYQSLINRYDTTSSLADQILIQEN